jgi:transcriptional regulator with XRE-family HTH domain
MERESWRNVGKRIRQLRKENNLTIRQLAVGCDLSPNAISLVERGEVAPTVLTLCKIAHALGVSASSLFQEICSTEVILIRAVKTLDKSLPESVFDLLRGKGDSMDSSPPGEACHTHLGQMTQLVLCVCGTIEYQVDDRCYLLNPGDHLTFHGEAFHRWRNQGAEPGVAVMVLTPPPDQGDPGG